MLRLAFVAGLFLHLSLGAQSQLKKFYSIRDVCSFDTVDFVLKAASGNTYIKNYSQNDHPMVVYGNPDLERINPSFTAKFTSRTCYAALDLENYNALEFGDGFSFVMSDANVEESEHYWKILVGDQKVYKFRMDYGIGNTEVDLSNIRMDNLWLKTGSANVRIGYQEESRNLIEMDTFFVKVDLGSLETWNLGNARAENFIADIGFGTAILDFSGQEQTEVRCDAKVGAGSLDVIIPDTDRPVIMYIKGSPFCGIRLADDFEEVEENVFVNRNYDPEAPDLMTFEIDLAVGTFTVDYSTK